ncbi:EscU/YscU/HrcU family type III secretion system export apparatus switch protein [Hydrogenothermus marinus]|uniref:Flagellar biosynthesis protein n=1 Tax=Hydrogenothermus marinus TaxID=133270 RepID=A0A3M0BRS7_9AQUI|nr:EscU/YscU/HrcU family type III secretion system export apparatus switch protein [Hydrogenothermus marinus]RMA97205.1 flagellar biosynthesis protein [Hydrogenothermus marinus]
MKDIKKAVALKYEVKKDNAPKVIAKGKEKIADKILEIAKKENIPIYEDPETLEILFSLDIGDEIPPELYQVIAEIFAYIISKKEEYKED